MMALLWAGLLGCVPSDRLAFPYQPVSVSDTARRYDTNGDGRVDFALRRADSDGRFDVLAYDDDQDGLADRLYRLSDYDARDVPHLIVLLDSVPFAALRERWAEDGPGGWSYFDEPVKMIAPFPSLSALCFSAILHAPPMPGMNNRHFDPRPQVNAVNNLIARRLAGYRNPWQRRLHYNIGYYWNIEAFLNPRPWLKTEFERARRALDQSPDPTTIVYIASSSAMLLQHGRAGLDAVLDELERFVLQVLYERQGAIKISVASDHGHTLRDAAWVDVEQILENAGYDVGQSLGKPGQVVVEIDGLLSYFGVHTHDPEGVSTALLARPEVETVSYMDGFAVVVADQSGYATIRREDDRLIYQPITADVLGYGQLAGQALSDAQWFDRTVDARFPDGPTRLWDAFHGRAVSTPQVMVTLKNGYCCGIGWFPLIVNVHSTHGGLNQINSAGFLMSMTGRTDGPVPARDVLETIAPGFTPRVRAAR